MAFNGMSHSNTEGKLEPAAEDSTMTRQIAQVLTRMESNMRESQEKKMGTMMTSQERQYKWMMELLVVLSQQGVMSGGPETLLQSSAAPPRKPLKSTKVGDHLHADGNNKRSVKRKTLSDFLTKT
ncbi:hypothetical protein CAPTEDRAFT_185922 [Capitella teleta]|uniref:Uncharacterized protein n=1 Tax=Capitella teleta TaxID=283909 RepID=R7TDA6_CAPTE|nr:hypothetical protein CAPTEDRAFT_185922 [Capitella teleta]|eukprot:ELT91718.1 hypothetical protein CAPTEDRAFT_185922 [Capitella teleta]